MEQPELKVYELPTAQLVPYANNAKIHDAEQVRQIERSIEQFGFNDPIAVWTNADGEPEIIEGDTLPLEELYEMLKNAFANLKAVSSEDCSYYVTSPPGGEIGLMMMMMRDAGLPVRHNLIWNKTSATFSMGRFDYDYKHEPIFYTWGKRHRFYGENKNTVLDFPKPRKCDLHPTMKPVELVAELMRNSSRVGDHVIDIFGWSGTTLVASEQLGRTAYIMEIDPHYCDVIIRRWEQLTGETAVKAAI